MDNTQKIGPGSLSGGSFFIQVLGGLGGGIFGTLIMLVVFLLGSSILKPVLKVEISQTDMNPMFIFVFLAMNFLGIVSANVLSSLFICFSDREKYQRISSTLFQIFFLNLLVFIFLAPIYVIVSKINLSLIAYIAGLHMILSSFGSALILKIISNNKYALLGVYSAVFAMIISLGLNLAIYEYSNDLTILLFVALPIIWFIYALIDGLFSMIYQEIYNIYGVDFLRSDITYGNDYKSNEEEDMEMSEEEKEKIYLENQEDISGKDFLKKQK